MKYKNTQLFIFLALVACLSCTKAQIKLGIDQEAIINIGDVLSKVENFQLKRDVLFIIHLALPPPHASIVSKELCRILQCFSIAEI